MAAKHYDKVKQYSVAYQLKNVKQLDVLLYNMLYNLPHLLLTPSPQKPSRTKLQKSTITFIKPPTRITGHNLIFLSNKICLNLINIFVVSRNKHISAT